MTRDEKEEKQEAELLLPQERRDYPRVAVNIKVRYRILEDDEADRALVKHFDPEKIFKEFSESGAINVSKSGLLMYSHEDIPEKKFVAISMYLPLPGLSCCCKAIAEVVRCGTDSAEAGRRVVALKFLKVIHHSLNKFKFVTLNDILDIKGGEDIKLP
ncbi:MAG TPA: hypothetical protein P5511_01595 [Candidatus Goldiibacteriota bacterium]|nr:hypothetical protein [Candidatus Goldiibacteriota bacterium]